MFHNWNSINNVHEINIFLLEIYLYFNFPPGFMKFDFIINYVVTN